MKNTVIPVSIPSHCAMMEPAQKALDDVFSSVKLSAPNVDFYMNTDGEKSTMCGGFRRKWCCSCV